MNVEELLSREKIQFKYAGKDLLINCINPEHEDNNPSMRVDRVTGAMGCFSCGFGGNIFTHFEESVDTLGIKVLYLKNKINKLRNGEVIMPVGREEFRRDYRGIQGSTFSKFGAFLSDDHEGRIMFPIYESSGRLIAMIGRYAYSDISPKYKVYPSGVDLPVFPEKVEVYRDTVIIVEGIFDFLNLWDKGVKNAVCIFGKSMGEGKNKRNNLKKFESLKIQGVKKVFILLDKGAESSANKLATMLDELFITEVINYPVFSKDKDAGNLTQDEVTKLKEFIYG